VELVKLQAELKFLDETSRKELNLAIEALCRDSDTSIDETGLAEIERQYQEIKRRSRPWVR